MSLKSIVKSPVSLNRCLNLGCGRRYHSAWTNLDLESNDPQVISHDITLGIPFEASSFNAVYHSHVLEHLNPDEGKQLIQECYRVLSPGGVLRVVVPDLERIARLYLETHQQAWAGDETASVNYNWMKMELLDQLVRKKSGGQMGIYMSRQEIKNAEFVQSRVGDELAVCQEPSASKAGREGSMLNRLEESTVGFRRRMARRFVRWTLGRSAEAAFDEGMFRSQGEIHRWMYDRYSLREICQLIGFESFRVCSAVESSIEDYSSYQLDSVEGQVRKPDSIFVECRKPKSEVISEVA
jgi:predicted SAM-dependent methyltransferase